MYVCTPYILLTNYYSCGTSTLVGQESSTGERFVGARFARISSLCGGGVAQPTTGVTNRIIRSELSPGQINRHCTYTSHTGLHNTLSY